MAKPTHARVGGSGTHRAELKDFVKLLSSVARDAGMRESETMHQWIKAAACAMLNPIVRHSPALTAANEAEYQEVVRHMERADKAMDRFSEMLGHMVMALEADPSDFIGPVFMEVCANENVGQFFTPHEVSKAIATVTFSNARDLLEQAAGEGRNFITLQEPACGSGGMVLASNQVLRDLGINPATQAHWVCIDVDLSCVRSAFIQLTLTGCSATVIHGNALTLEEWRAFPTLCSRLFPKTLPRKSSPPEPRIRIRTRPPLPAAAE